MSKGSVNAPSFFENRRYPRYKADHSIVIEFQNVKTIVFCVDYSEGGFGAIIEAELPIGEIMSVVFPMEDRKPTCLQVMTTYRKNSRYGFQFVAPKSSKRRTFADFFRERIEGDF